MEQKKARYYEPQLDSRVTRAQARAQTILNGDIKTEEDFTLSLIYIIDRERNKGIFSDYYQERTLDELVFEAELVMAKPLPAAERGSKIIEKAGTEAKEELGDWVEKEMGDMDSMFMEDAKTFMETGEFKT